MNGTIPVDNSFLLMSLLPFWAVLAGLFFWIVLHGLGVLLRSLFLDD